MKKTTGLALFGAPILGGAIYGWIMKTPDIKKNPHPKMRYEVTISVDGAPGSFDSVGGFMQYEVTNLDCVPVTGAPLNPLRIPPMRNPRIAFARVSDNVYRGTVYADYFQDEDYFGLGECHWSLMSVGAELKVKQLTLVPHLSPENLFLQKSEVTYFMDANYRDNDKERSSFGYMDRSRLKPELQKNVFSITMAAKEDFE